MRWIKMDDKTDYHRNILNESSFSYIFPALHAFRASVPYVPSSLRCLRTFRERRHVI